MHVQARDAAGNESAVLTSTDNISVGGAPVIKTFSGPNANTYGIGGNLDIQVTFDRSVIVTGTPQLPLRIGTQDRQASYTSGSGSNTLTFRYVVVSGDRDNDGIALGASGVISLNGGAINGSTNASVSFSAHSFSAVLVDAVLPVVAITSTHTAEINSSNAANYQVSGTCKSGVVVQVRVGTVAPAAAPTCTASGTWTATLNLGSLNKGSTTITASQTDSVGMGTATPISATVGDFEQIAIATQK